MVKRFKAGRSNIDRDVLDGSTDAPYGATIMNDVDSRTPHALAVGVRQYLSRIFAMPSSIVPHESFIKCVKTKE